MINLYDYYSSPEELNGYENRIHFFPILAYEEILNGNKDPELLDVLKKDPEYAFFYALNTIKGRWPEAEPFIMKDPYYAYCYAEDIIKGRWLEAEPTILSNEACIYYYAAYVIGHRWPEAEPIIMKDPFNWDYYKKHFGIVE